MKHTHAHNSLLILASSVFIVTVALYVYMYLAVNAQTRRVVIAKDIQKVQKMDEQQIDELQKLYSRTEPDRDRMYGLFVLKKDIVSFIESLEAVGTASGAVVEITSIQELPPPEVTDGQVAEQVVGDLKAHIEAKGSWSQVSKVLISLETMQKASKIENVRINVSEKVWVLSLDITAHIL